MGPTRLPGTGHRLFRQDQLKCKYVDITLDNFLRNMHIVAFSLVQMTQYARPLMQGGSILTPSYLGVERVIPHYNVMGMAKAALESSVLYLVVGLGPENIQVNAISAGPIKTLAASGIGDFRYIMRWNEMDSPLRRTVSIEEVSNASLLISLGHRHRHHRRGHACRCRLFHRQHEGRRCIRHLSQLTTALSHINIVKGQTRYGRQQFRRAFPLHELG